MGAEPQTFYVIPARGGSKGIPHKNLRRVGGRSLVAWSVAAGLAQPRPGTVVVSTEDAAIAVEARDAGAVVVDRPVELATDSAGTEPVMAHVLDALAADDADTVVLLQPTSPLRRPDTVDAVVAAVREGGFTSALTVRETHDFRWRPAADGGAVRLYEERTRRQDHRPSYVETGSIYATTVAAFRCSGDRVSGSTKLVVVDAWEAIDVDALSELMLVDALAAHWTYPPPMPAEPER